MPLPTEPVGYNVQPLIQLGVEQPAMLALGFLVCAFADIKSVAWFGLLLSLAMTTAVIADLTVLPALLASSCKSRISDSPMGTALTEQTGDA